MGQQLSIFPTVGGRARGGRVRVWGDRAVGRGRINKLFRDVGGGRTRVRYIFGTMTQDDLMMKAVLG